MSNKLFAWAFNIDPWLGFIVWAEAHWIAFFAFISVLSHFMYWRNDSRMRDKKFRAEHFKYSMFGFGCSVVFLAVALIICLGVFEMMIALSGSAKS